jgi:phasin family protein
MALIAILRGYIMSNHKQSSATPNAVDGRHLNLETALRIATVIAEANERLFKIQTEAANVAFAENSKHLKALLNTANTKDSGALLAEWTNLYQASMRRGLDVTRSCFEIVPQTQAEIAKLVGEPFASANKETQQYLDQFTKAIGDGRDAAAASVKDFLAKAIASASAQRPTKKEKVA